ncbi:hypothetical protein [uncultured Sphingomonas sp.]|uniref:hypothetical protein n=1 Tax=uncultured Sphingomonas sp. TaxID=158754 RepID=UPI00261588F6|nr:hypothetical protein [uncultured Sphingomonas sp.]
MGQIEVLRSPQGTSRGAPSISGAVTITTRRPDLDEFGGYVQLQYGEGDHRVAQGAINIPIIKGVFAPRAAANIEDSNANRVRSANSSVDPDFRSRVYRISALLQPTDTISIGAMYQRRRQARRYSSKSRARAGPATRRRAFRRTSMLPLFVATSVWVCRMVQRATRRGPT